MTARQALSSQDAAYLLRRELGPLRTWSDFLADCIRGRTSFKGHTLLPMAYLDGRGLCGRPVYAPEEVAAFIAAVSALGAADPDPTAVRPVLVDLSPAPSWLPPQFRRATLASTQPRT